MRNLAQYPVTKQEVEEILNGLTDKDVGIGSITGVVLSYIKEFIEENDDRLENFLRKKHTTWDY